MFAKFAANDIQRWRLAVGRRVRHTSLGWGTIRDVTEKPWGCYISIRFDTDDMDTCRLFTPDSFRNPDFFLDMDIHGVPGLQSYPVDRDKRRAQTDVHGVPGLQSYPVDRDKRRAQTDVHGVPGLQSYPVDRDKRRAHLEAKLRPYARVIVPGTQATPLAPLIFHMTHVDNLASILAERCLWCDKEQYRRRLCRVSIGHRNIKLRRWVRPVTVRPGGVVADYVPFYFTPISPMLYAIHSEAVESYRGGQEHIIHLVSSVGAVCLSGRQWVLTDRNASANDARFYDSLDRLDQVDWEIIRAPRWHDVKDGKQRRQAEFLVHRSFPWELVEEIGVYSESLAERVMRLLEGHQHQPPVRVRRDEWYFRGWDF